MPQRATHHLNRGDILWLRWVTLSLSVLICVATLMASGMATAINEWHTALLQGTPFNLSETGAQNGSILSPAVIFICCIPLTLYWTAIMIYQKTLLHRTELTLLALATLALPGLLCVLWDKALHTAPLIFCVFTTWLLIVCVPFFGKKSA